MDGNTPAFPPNAGWESNNPQHRGLSKREYFAAMTMQALISASAYNGDARYVEYVVAQNAFKMADAMIKESENATR